MKAMILAAGRGKRMLHLTDAKPKPLIEINGKTLIEFQIERLVELGVKEIIINVAYFANQIIASVGFGERWGISIQYSHETLGGLETGGGVRQALPLLSDPFLVVNADVRTNYDLTRFHQVDMSKRLGHVVLVNNPDHNLEGDYSVDQDGFLLKEKGSASFTFAGISCFRKELFSTYKVGEHFTIPAAMKYGIANQLVSAELHSCEWHDVGTPCRLARVSSAREI